MIRRIVRAVVVVAVAFVPSAAVIDESLWNAGLAEVQQTVNLYKTDRLKSEINKAIEDSKRMGAQAPALSACGTNFVCHESHLNNIRKAAATAMDNARKLQDGGKIAGLSEEQKKELKPAYLEFQAAVKGVYDAFESVTKTNPTVPPAVSDRTYEMYQLSLTVYSRVVSDVVRQLAQQFGAEFVPPAKDLVGPRKQRPEKRKAVIEGNGR